MLISDLPKSGGDRLGVGKSYNKLAIFIITIAFLSSFQIVNPGAEDKGESDPDIIAMRAILDLHQNGAIRTSIAGPNYFVDVDTSYWKGLISKDKEKLFLYAQLTAQQIMKKSGHKLEFVIFRDMTSKTPLGTLSLKSGKLEIEN
jgi:hypothetical protein